MKSKMPAEMKKDETGMKIELDEGYMYGLGAFETAAVEDGRPVFLAEHLMRLENTLLFLGIPRSVGTDEVYEYLDGHYMEHGALKIMASQENLAFTVRENPYKSEDYVRGFDLGFSMTRRNETSKLTYHKTFNYGDCIIAKREAKRQGLDDMVFVNTKGAICESSTANLFFVKDNILYSPQVNCGLLHGIVRDFVYKTERVEDSVIYPADLVHFDECFLTNSLMGIMPVRKLGSRIFECRKTAERLLSRYKREVL